MFGLTEGKNIVFFAADKMMTAEAAFCQCCGELGYVDAEPTASMGDAVVIPNEIRELIADTCPLCLNAEAA